MHELNLVIGPCACFPCFPSSRVCIASGSCHVSATLLPCSDHALQDLSCNAPLTKTRPDSINSQAPAASRSEHAAVPADFGHADCRYSKRRQARKRGPPHPRRKIFSFDIFSLTSCTLALLLQAPHSYLDLRIRTRCGMPSSFARNSFSPFRETSVSPKTATCSTLFPLRESSRVCECPGSTSQLGTKRKQDGAEVGLGR